MKVQPRNADAFVATAWKKVRAVLLFGPDSGLARERAKTLIAAGTDTAKFPFALAEIGGPSFKDAPSLLRDELAAVPFGGGRRVVHVRDLTDWRMADRCAEAAAAALESWPGDVVLLASGTATLEAMLCKRPMVVGNRIAPLTYRIVKGLGLLKVERYALPNVLAGKDIAPELMQDDCTPERLSAAVLHWFREPEAVAALQPTYVRLHEELRQDASASAAAAVAGLIAPSAGAQR